jgi:hypothetical protein
MPPHEDEAARGVKLSVREVVLRARELRQRARDVVARAARSRIEALNTRQRSLAAVAQIRYVLLRERRPDKRRFP